MKDIQTSAPGSIMLMGEHAVLHGAHALAAAVNQRLRIRLAPRSDDRLSIQSALGHYDTTLQIIQEDHRFLFMLEALRRYRKQIPGGCDITVTADFSSDVGLGSSAAVTIALVRALHKWIGLSLAPDALFSAGYEIIHGVQGLGSGADAAACTYGGIVLYRMQPRLVRKLDALIPITLVYSGHKEPTPKVVQWVETRRAAYPAVYEQIFQGMDAATQQTANLLDSAGRPQCADLFNIQQGFMDALGVNTPELEGIIRSLRKTPDITAAKISGSGLGDCALGIGTVNTWNGPGKWIPVQLSRQGVT